MRDDDGKTTAVSYLQLFRYADKCDRALIVAGLAAAVLSSLCLPAMVLLLAVLTDAFVRNHGNSVGAGGHFAASDLRHIGNLSVIDQANRTTLPDASSAHFIDNVQLFITGSCVTAVAQFLLSAVFVYCLDLSAARQTNRMRSLYFGSALRQEMAWYDTHATLGVFASRMSEDILRVQAGLDDKLGVFVAQVCVMLVCVVSASWHGWQLTLVVLAAVPLLVAAVFAAVHLQRVLAARGSDSYSRAAGVAMETFSAITTVTAFAGQRKAIDRYREAVHAGGRWWVFSAAVNALFAGLVWLLIFCSYALTFWYGTHLVLSGSYQPSSLIVVFFSVMTAAIQLGQATPFITSFSEAQTAAAAVFSVIDRSSLIDPLSHTGKRLSHVAGSVEFRDVAFCYPARPSIKVLRGFSLHVQAGETVALVGVSGCGKSTCLQLLQRLYQPLHGQVLLDGCQVDSLSVSWLRSQVVVVPQQPALFSGTILQNIQYGCEDTSLAAAESAARVAQLWQFVSSLPQGWHTVLGATAVTHTNDSGGSGEESGAEAGMPGGGQLSGGQRQRVALARAVLASPAVLLLDEATSALDLHTETALLHALKQCRRGRTTLLVAHRLATLQHWADRVAVLQHGQLAELGSHDELMSGRGASLGSGAIYRQLFAQQTAATCADLEFSVDQNPRLVAGNHGNSASDSTSGSDVGGTAHHGNSAGNHGNSVGNHGNSVGNHGNTPGNHGNSVGNHGNSVGNHGNISGNHGNSVGNHGNTPSNHGNSVGSTSPTLVVAAEASDVEQHQQQEGRLGDFACRRSPRRSSMPVRSRVRRCHDNTHQQPVMGECGAPWPTASFNCDDGVGPPLVGLVRSLSMRLRQQADLGPANCHPPATRRPRVNTLVSGSVSGNYLSTATTTTTTPPSRHSQTHTDSVLWRLWRLSRPEWRHLAVGTVAAAVCGCALPVYALFFGEVLANLSEPDHEVARARARFHSLIFLAVGVVMGVAMFLQGTMYGIAGVRLTARIRRSLFAALLRQEMAFFDQPQHCVGALCSRLATDASNINGACGPRLGNTCQAMATLLLASGVAASISWRLAVVLLPFVPLVLLACYLQTVVMSGSQLRQLVTVDHGASLAEEALRNIRSVASLRLERSFLQRYTVLLDKSLSHMNRVSAGRGLVYGFANAVPILAYAACMGYGGKLVADGELEFQQVFKAGESLILGTMMVGQAVAFSPSYQMALSSARRVFSLLNRRSLIDPSLAAGLRMTSVSGAVSLDNVSFSYADRPAVPVLRSFTASVAAGRKVALVGESGCGKSTVLRLLLRFYEPHSGTVSVDGCDISRLDVSCLRAHMSLVAQDPVLFSGSIRDNIAYGDNSRDVSDAEIETAARQADLHEFVQSLPDKYDTQLGDNALTQLSGGQRQRVALARALLRRPAVLLLDEATSALDSVSEQRVQMALQSSGVTCVAVTHRLATVAPSADLVLLVHQGSVVETGTHEQLMQRRARYWRLFTASTTTSGGDLHN